MYPQCDMPETSAPTPSEVRPIHRTDLQQKLASDEDFLFVMAMDKSRFDMAHIEGSISFDELLNELPDIPHDREIVVYCTDVVCAASKLRATFLVNQGFSNVLRYAGGLADWDANGLPLVTQQLV